MKSNEEVNRKAGRACSRSRQAGWKQAEMRGPMGAGRQTWEMRVSKLGAKQGLGWGEMKPGSVRTGERIVEEKQEV